MADPIDTAMRVVSSALPVGMPPGHEITDAGTCIVEVAELRVVLAEVDRLRADNATLRDLLAKALPWVDPNESNDGHLLTVAITDALGDHRG